MKDIFFTFLLRTGDTIKWSELKRTISADQLLCSHYLWRPSHLMAVLTITVNTVYFTAVVFRVSGRFEWEDTSSLQKIVSFLATHSRAIN